MAMRLLVQAVDEGGEIEGDRHQLAIVGFEAFLGGLPAVQQIVELEGAVEGDLAHGEADEARLAQDQRFGPGELHDVLVLGRDLRQRGLVVDHPLDLAPVLGQVRLRGGGVVDLGENPGLLSMEKISPAPPDLPVASSVTSSERLSGPDELDDVFRLAFDDGHGIDPEWITGQRTRASSRVLSSDEISQARGLSSRFRSASLPFGAVASRR